MLKAISTHSLEVAGSNTDLIAISNPKNSLIDNYVTKNNWTRGGLFKGRTTENKSSLVVNSSTTHSISFDLATVGVRLSNNLGVGVSRKADEIKSENTFVNASDYTNSGSFIGNAAASGTVAVGVR